MLHIHSQLPCYITNTIKLYSGIRPQDMSSKYEVSYSALGMSDDNSSINQSGRIVRNVNFQSETIDGCPIMLPPNGRRGSKLFTRPRSMSVWSDISRTSIKADERLVYGLANLLF